jgi:uncharacterized protein YuzE
MTTLRKGIIRVKGHMLQQISIDPQYQCLYLQFSGEKISKTVEHTDFINIDLDKNGQLVGIEFVGVKKIRHGLKHIFLELAKVYNRPELKRIPFELKRDLAVV